MKEFVINALKALMIISAIAALISPIVFREGGIIWGKTTRKAIIAISVCFGIFLLSACLAMWIYDPSQYLTALTCGVGGMIASGIYFTFMYIRLPYASRKIDDVLKKREEYLGKMQERAETTLNEEKKKNK